MTSPDNMRTVSIRIPGLEESEAAITAMKHGYHLRNMIIIALNMAANSQPELYRLLRQPDIMRAILGEQPGGKKAVLVAKARVLIEGSDRDLMEILAAAKKEAAHDLDIKHVYKIAKAIKGEFDAYFTKLSKGEKASKPRARKIRDVSSMALPLDKERLKWVPGGLRITFHKDHKILLPIHQEKLAKVLDLDTIKSYRISYDGRHVALNISYEKAALDKRCASARKKVAAIDLGVNNLCSIFIADEQTPSKIISGKAFKHANHVFNQKKAKLSSTKDLQLGKMRDIEQEWQDALENGVDEADTDWHELLEDLDVWQAYDRSYQASKTAIDSLYAKRKSYFDTNFHKIARGILRDLEAAQVTCLVLSRDVMRAKQGCSMGRVGNQRFISIPFAILVDALKLYGLEHGIEVIDDLDEAYSSKTNCQNGDIVRARTDLPGRSKQETKELRATVFQGRRHKSSFKCSQTGKIWHADLNGAVNIVRIYLSNEGMRNHRKLPDYKLCSPEHLQGKKLFEWLDRPYKKAA